MQTMMAFGLPESGELPSLMHVPIPDIDSTDVLVEMRAVGVGLHDRYTHPGTVTFPYPIGIEGSGTIAAIGDDVTAFTIGDRVMINGLHAKGGTWAEFAAIEASLLIPMPEGLSFEDAAALPVAGMTALVGVNALQLGASDKLFIAGASGAIGTIAIQLAVKRDYRVAASSSPRNHDYMRSLGVNLAVDYRNPSWTEQVKTWSDGGVDAALAIQRGTGQSSLPAVRCSGAIVTISGDQVRTERDVRISQMMHSPDTRAGFLQIASDVASGEMRVVLEKTYPFDQAMAALEKTESGHAQGKVVIIVRDH